MIICDCDEVLLHFVAPFQAYLQSVHALTLTMDSFALAGNVRNAAGEMVDAGEFLPLLEGFFDTHMDTQTPAPGAVAALATLAEQCDVIILTNLIERHAEQRRGELARLGMPYRVIGNQGPKGKPVQALIDEYRPTRAVFIDDLPPHHGSVRAEAPDVHRVHLIADPQLHGLIPPAPDAHARFDDWATALPYIRGYLGV